MVDTLEVARYGPWCLIAGASEGIGAAFARRLAAQGFALVLVARRAAPLEALADELRAAHAVEVRTLSADLAAPDAIDAVARACVGLEIGLLIYNAGAVSRLADFLDDPAGALRVTVLNVIGQTTFAAHFGAGMRKRGRGGIILLGSIAGTGGVGRLVTYAAAKAYSQVFAEGLWYELRPHGVDVLALISVTTRTPAIAELGMPLDDPNFPSVEPEQVVSEGLAALPRGPVHYVNGSEAVARSLYALPRADAVEAVSRAMEQAIPPAHAT